VGRGFPCSTSKPVETDSCLRGGNPSSAASRLPDSAICNRADRGPEVGQRGRRVVGEGDQYGAQGVAGPVEDGAYFAVAGSVAASDSQVAQFSTISVTGPTPTA
jgi:hypothetical protein